MIKLDTDIGFKITVEFYCFNMIDKETLINITIQTQWKRINLFLIIFMIAH